MEKLAYLLWNREAQDADELRDQLLGSTAAELLAAGALRLQVNVADSAVAPAAPMRMMSTRPLPSALVTLALHTHLDRKPAEKALAKVAPRIAGYLVLESEPIVNTKQRAREGERTPGYSQLALIQRPPRLDAEHWLQIWQGSHTTVAKETQSTFRYVQNRVVQTLTYAAPRFDAIVEECFPAAAMTSQHAFYDAVGDDAKLDANRKRMLESSGRFIDFDRIDVIPMSEYVMRG
ncbi:MAG: EthD domain-containing protein [Deltaproteobacteria bacterium]|nr:EthD domain-containing protein [Deltaproteobacteria bacterium]